MARLDVNELRGKSVDELNEKLMELLREQFNYRMQKTSGQLGQPHLISQVKRDIARVKTVITEKTGS